MKLKQSLLLTGLVIFILKMSSSFSIVQAQTIQTDCLGAEYLLDEYIVVFHDTTSANTRNSIRNKYGITSYESCLCDTVELWDLDGKLPNLSPEEKKAEITSELGVESIDFNYLLGNSPSPQVSNTYQQTASPTPPNKVITAVIDYGINTSHSYFDFTQFWYNPNETNNGQGQDDDGNCLTDDIRGYDFANGDGDPTETKKDHGTHVAGIINTVSNGSAEIIDLKIFDAVSNQNTLFKATCATYYAIEKQAKVINMSWGWSGLPAECIKNAILRAGRINCALVVCSAGNDNHNVDDLPHYPSGYLLDNIIEVTALDHPSQEIKLASYANRGKKVDLAVDGTWKSATKYGVEFKTGTSMSAAAISGLAARVFAEAPGATFLDVKNCILMTASVSENISPDHVNGSKYFDFTNPISITNALTCIPNFVTNGCPTLLTENELCVLIGGDSSHPIAGLDCDQDGLINYFECLYEKDPLIYDDQCRLADEGIIDICVTINNDPNHPITDMDCDNGGIPNDMECSLGHDPLDSIDDCAIVLNQPIDFCAWILSNSDAPIASSDCDQDGLSNLFECLTQGNPGPPQATLTFNVTPQESLGTVRTNIGWTGTQLQHLEIVNQQTGIRVIQEHSNFNQLGSYQNDYDFSQLPSGSYEAEVRTGCGMTEATVFQWVNQHAVVVTASPNPTSGPVTIQVDNPFNVPFHNISVYDNSNFMPVVSLPIGPNTTYPLSLVLDMNPFPVGVYQVCVHSSVGGSFTTTLIVQ